MKLRATLLTLGLLLGTVAAAQGQGQGDFQQRRMQAMFKDITLSQPEQTRVDSIMAAYRSQMPPRTQGSPPDSAAMAARRTLTEKQNRDIRAVLTPDQQELFDRNVKEMSAGMQQRRPR